MQNVDVVLHHYTITTKTMQYSDERVDQQIEYVDSFLRGESLCKDQTKHVNYSPHSRMNNIMRHFTSSVEAIEDFIFQNSGGLQSRL